MMARVRNKLKKATAQEHLDMLLDQAAQTGLARLHMDARAPCVPCDKCGMQSICRERQKQMLWAPCEVPSCGDVIALLRALEAEGAGPTLTADEILRSGGGAIARWEAHDIIMPELEKMRRDKVYRAFRLYDHQSQWLRTTAESNRCSVAALMRDILDWAMELGWRDCRAYGDQLVHRTVRIHEYQMLWIEQTTNGHGFDTLSALVRAIVERAKTEFEFDGG